MQIYDQVTLLDEILGSHRAALGCDYEPYRHHCYRVLNFTLAQCENTADTVSKVAIATAFHDLGIWTARTFDYLPPSRRLARDYLDSIARSAWQAEIDIMIAQHHRMRRIRDGGAEPARPGEPPLAELFRRADWIDVSLRWLTFDLPRDFINDVCDRFPDEGFHTRLMQMTLRRMATHPFSPLPMMRL